jgi:hypothetical protein
LNDLQYLELMYEAGAADYFDALAVHTYGMTIAPTPNHSRDGEFPSRGTGARHHDPLWRGG